MWGKEGKERHQKIVVIKMIIIMSEDEDEGRRKKGKKSESQDEEEKFLSSSSPPCVSRPLLNLAIAQPSSTTSPDAHDSDVDDYHTPSRSTPGTQVLMMILTD